ncbi:hypothetical protein TOPH_07256, partial [Tolypocladium ophioglossoides CBS 100239]
MWDCTAPNIDMAPRTGRPGPRPLRFRSGDSLDQPQLARWRLACDRHLARLKLLLGVVGLSRFAVKGHGSGLKLHLCRTSRRSKPW